MNDKTKSQGFDLSSLESDEVMANEGVWIEFFGDSELLIAQNGNDKYQAFINLEYKKHRRILEQEDKNADKLSEKIYTEAAARFLLLGWKNIMIDGTIAKYDWKIGVEQMDKNKVLKAEVTEQARKLFNFQKSAEEKDIENAKT